MVISEGVADLYISTKIHKNKVRNKVALRKYQQIQSEYSAFFSFFDVELWVSMLYNDL